MDFAVVRGEAEGDQTVNFHIDEQFLFWFAVADAFARRRVRDGVEDVADTTFDEQPLARHRQKAPALLEFCSLKTLPTALC